MESLSMKLNGHLMAQQTPGLLLLQMFSIGGRQSNIVQQILPADARFARGG